MKKIVKIVILSTIIILLTGCVSSIESSKLREFLLKEGYIGEDWVFVEEYFKDGGTVFPYSMIYTVYKVGEQYNMIYIDDKPKDDNKKTLNEYDIRIYYNIKAILEENPLYGNENILGEEYFVNYDFNIYDNIKKLDEEEKKILFLEYYKVAKEQV